MQIIKRNVFMIECKEYTDLIMNNNRMAFDRKNGLLLRRR